MSVACSYLRTGHVFLPFHLVQGKAKYSSNGFFTDYGSQATKKNSWDTDVHTCNNNFIELKLHD